MQRMAYNSFPLWIGGQCSNMIWCSGIGQLGCLWSKTDTWSQKLWADSARWQFRFFQAKYSQHSPSKDASFSSSAVSAPDSDDTFGYFREFTSRTLWFLLQGCRGDGDAREAGHWGLVGFDEKWLAEWLAKTIDFSLDFSLTSHWLHAQIQMTTWLTRWISSVEIWILDAPKSAKSLAAHRSASWLQPTDVIWVCQNSTKAVVSSRHRHSIVQAGTTTLEVAMCSPLLPSL